MGFLCKRTNSRRILPIDPGAVNRLRLPSCRLRPSPRKLGTKFTHGPARSSSPPGSDANVDPCALEVNDMRGLARIVAILLAVTVFAPAASAAVKCRGGAFAVSDARDILAIRGAIARACPCASFDGSTGQAHGDFKKCGNAVISDATDGTPVLGFTLRPQCQGELKKYVSHSTCGYPAADNRVICCEVKAITAKTKAGVKKLDKCVTASSGSPVRSACFASSFTDICTADIASPCRTRVAQETVDLPSAAEGAHTPGTSGVVVTNPKLLAQFGGPSFSLNNARYTRWRLAGPEQQPDAILVLVPGFEGGAADFRILAENLIVRANAGGQLLEVWGFDRRSNQLEDLVGADIAEEFLNAPVALDWFFGGELTLPLHPTLVAGPNRRAVFYDTQADVPFIADWTPLLFARDIDAVVTAARAAARNQNAFLGGHSMGTTFAARYASTDFNLTGVGAPDPGYAKVRGIVLLEGGGGSTAGAPLTADTLDRIEAKFDGGLFGAVRDNAARCVDGLTLCTIANEANDCIGQLPPKCTPPTTSYSVVPGLLNARILASSEPATIQTAYDPDTGRQILIADQGSVGNNAVAKVPDLSGLSLLPPATAFGGLGSFIDDDSFIASLAPFLSTSVGSPGPTVGGLVTWRDITEGIPVSVLPNNGPPPTSLPASVWGQEKELTRFDKLARSYYEGHTNFTDWYYPNAGLSVTSITGVCSSGFCSVGNVGMACSTNAQCSQAVSLDSSALSIGRGRRDIENLTQAAAINVPVITVCGTNGLATVPGVYVPFATSIAPCTAPSCNGTPRVVNPTMPNTAFPTFGGVNGGFEVVVAEGLTHVDVLSAEDVAANPIVPALTAFLARNAL